MNSSAYASSTALTMDQIAFKAPAALATSPAPHINLKRYTFTPTTEVIANMQELGFHVSDARQSLSKDDMRKNFGTHFVTFQHPDLTIKNSEGKMEAKPTIVLINSHDGVTPFKFEMGLYRLVCSNGLMVRDQDFGSFNQRHTKLDFNAVKQIMNEKVDKMKEVTGKISQWNMREMTAGERIAFASEALALRLNTDRKPEDYEINEILNPRRDVDAANTLWHVYNRVQENMIKGGFQMNNRQARPITNPVQDMVLNQGLWQLAEQYAN